MLQHMTAAPNKWRSVLQGENYKLHSPVHSLVLVSLLPRLSWPPPRAASSGCALCERSMQHCAEPRSAAALLKVLALLAAGLDRSDQGELAAVAHIVGSLPSSLTQRAMLSRLKARLQSTL